MKRITVYAASLLALVCFAHAAEIPEKDQKPVKHVNPKEAERLISEHKVTIIDIRTPDEFKDGHIAGATNINYLGTNFAQAISSLAKTNSYLVHCAVGGRSTRSLKIFNQQNFESIYHLDGGLEAWKEAGLPVEK